MLDHENFSVDIYGAKVRENFRPKGLHFFGSGNWLGDKCDYYFSQHTNNSEIVVTWANGKVDKFDAEIVPTAIIDAMSDWLTLPLSFDRQTQKLIIERGNDVRTRIVRNHIKTLTICDEYLTFNGKQYASFVNTLFSKDTKEDMISWAYLSGTIEVISKGSNYEKLLLANPR
jgi:hypothetical protein